MAKVVQVSDDWIKIYNDEDELIFEDHRLPDTPEKFQNIVEQLGPIVIEIETYEVE